MDVQNEIPSRFTAIKTFAIEIGIILVLTAIMIFVLDFLKVIDIKALVTPQENVQQVSTVNNTSAQNQPRPGNATNSAQNNLDLQNLRLIAKNKALHFAQTISEFEGKIKTIELTGGEDTASKRKFEVRMELIIGSESATTVYLIPKEAVGKLKVRDEDKATLDIDDIKLGDRVVITTNIGVFRQYPNNYNSILIEKIK